MIADTVGAAPPDRAVAVAAGQHQRVIQQGTQGLPGGTLVQEGREHQRDAFCTSWFGSLVTTPVGSRSRPAGSVSARSPRSALLSRPAVRRPRRVHLDLGDGALEAEQQAPVRGAGVVDPVAIGDQAVVIAAQVEQRVPVGAVRDSRVTSHDRIKPISPSVTRPIRSVKPWRFAAPGR